MACPPPLKTPRRIGRRALLLGGGAAALLGAAGCAGTAPRGATARTPQLRLIGQATLAHRLMFRNTPVGGLSGLDYDPARDVWYALSDDRSEFAPARFYTLRIVLTPQRLATPELLDVVTLRQPGGRPYPGRGEDGEVADPEALRFRPQTGTLLWTSEGDARLGLAPFVREVDAAGHALREFSLPPMFAMDRAQRSGPRNNLAFEGLALTPDGSGAWVAMENALVQDGPMPGVGLAGGPCRFTLFDVAGGRALRQIAYLPDAIPQAPVPASAHADNGVSEILMLDAHRLLVLERAYMAGVGNSLRLYLIDTRQGTDTLGQPVLRAGEFRAAPKTLLADFAAFRDAGLERLDNTEGMAWGPLLPNGHRSLVFVSDDNFNPAQVTQFLAFEFTE
jgi:hypothetical protein